MKDIKRLRQDYNPTKSETDLIIGSSTTNGQKNSDEATEARLRGSGSGSGSGSVLFGQKDPDPDP